MSRNNLNFRGEEEVLGDELLGEMSFVSGSDKDGLWEREGTIRWDKGDSVGVGSGGDVVLDKEGTV